METDFINAFARLLRDGKLRDQFAASPEAAAASVGLRRSDWLAWRQLSAADVECQADVLLRKRLDLVKFFAPETCRRAGESLWQKFQSYARMNWPATGSAKLTDTFNFCRHLREQDQEAVAVSEWNRMAFIFSARRLALHGVRMSIKGKRRMGLQLFIRGRGQRWHEYLFFIGV
jgi:hypothetical protein